MINVETWISPAPHSLDLGLPPGGPFTPLRDPWVDRPLSEILRDITTRFPNRIAIDDGKRRLSYRDLWAEFSALANRLVEQTCAGDAVGVLLPSSASFLVAVLATLAARRVCVPLDLNYPAARNKDILCSAGLHAVIVQADAQPAGLELPDGLPRLSPEIGAGARATFREQPGSNDDPALVLYTSGSTGRPKGIVNSTASLLQRVLQHVNAGHITEHDRFMTLSSPCTIAGMREALTALLTGAALHSVSMQRAGLREVRHLIRDAQITILNSVPAMLRSLVAAGSETESIATFASLRLVRLGGDVMFWSDVPGFRRVLPKPCAIQVAYSSTESTGSQWFVPQDATPSGPFVPVGRLLPGLRATIVDEDGNAVRPGDPGELLIRGRFVTLGHWEAGQVRSGPTWPDPENPANRVLATGDIVRLHADGLVDLLGRKDRQVKINGQRAEPTEVEAVLRWSPHLSDVLVLTNRDRVIPRFIACVVPRPGAPATLTDELMAATRAALPRFMQPSRIHVLDAIPRLPSAKPDLATLASRIAQADDDQAPAEASQPVGVPGDVQNAVFQAWRDLLGRDALDRGLRFDDAGGDSLKLMQLVFQLETALGRHLPLDLFDLRMQPSDMIRAIACRKAAVPEQDEARPLVLLMPGVNGDEPRLAQFRAELKASLRFAVMEYPDWPDIVRGRMGFEALVDHVVRQATDLVPDGPMLLAGYSYGGAVACATAERLVRAGRSVALLAILDTDLQPRPSEPVLILPRLMLRWVNELARGMRKGDVPGSLGEFLAKIATHPRMTPLLDRMARIEIRSTGQTAFAFHGWMRIFLRRAALRPWRALRGMQLLAINTVLFRSEAHLVSDAADLCWSERSASVRVIDVGGNHHTMLDAPNLERLCKAFEQIAINALDRFALREAGPAKDPIGANVEVPETI